MPREPTTESGQSGGQAAASNNGAVRSQACPPVVRARPKGGFVLGLVVAAIFALLMTPVVMSHTWWAADGAFASGEPAPITVRTAHFTAAHIGDSQLREGAIVVGRGQVLTQETAERVAGVRDHEPSGWPAWVSFFVAFWLMGTLFATHLSRSHRGRLVRTQVVTLALLVGAAILVKALLMLTAVSALAVPVALFALAATVAVDLSTGLATGLLAAATLGTLVPFDPGVITILAVQACGAALVLGDRRHFSTLHTAGAGVLGGAVAALSYLVLYSLNWGTVPVYELDDPLRSPWLASFAGGCAGGLLAVLAHPLYQFALGEITRSRLVELEDLSNPLLKQIAEKAPGTWQHSLAMANMAEIAANSIGANGRLVRVGAYYHDLGKSLQPKYFVENLATGEPSPHDSLSPEVSADAIFSHVTEGIRLGRKAGLPERIVDFMHMHHGDGLLEYFWAKCRDRDNPRGLTEDDFRYPGLKPQSKETAILAIVDAVEAASRTLRSPDEQAIASLVERIVYGKLHLGQLDESSLTMAELRQISNSLKDTIRHAHHGRIEYPWQRAQTHETSLERPSTAAEAQAASGTGRYVAEPRLDSLDVPRPNWRGRSPTKAPAPSIASAAAEALADTASLSSLNQASHIVNSAPAAVPERPAPAQQPDPAVSAVTVPLTVSPRQVDGRETAPGHAPAPGQSGAMAVWEAALQTAESVRHAAGDGDIDSAIDSAGESLDAGTMSAGPDEVTRAVAQRPRSELLQADEPTVRRAVLLPDVARRPEDRQTRKQPIIAASDPPPSDDDASPDEVDPDDVKSSTSGS